MVLSATQPPRRGPPPPRHNFVVSAITFEGFKLYVLQLSSHPKWPPAAIL